MEKIQCKTSLQAQLFQEVKRKTASLLRVRKVKFYELPFDHGFVCLGMRAQSKSLRKKYPKLIKDTNVRVEKYR